MDTRDIRETFGWSQREMSKFTGIPLRTIENWDYRRNLKQWLHDYIMRSELGACGLRFEDLEEERKEN